MPLSKSSASAARCIRLMRWDAMISVMVAFPLSLIVRTSLETSGNRRVRRRLQHLSHFHSTSRSPLSRSQQPTRGFDIGTFFAPKVCRQHDGRGLTSIPFSSIFHNVLRLDVLAEGGC